jgi:hypothetical protein
VHCVGLAVCVLLPSNPASSVTVAFEGLGHVSDFFDDVMVHLVSVGWV